MNTQAGDISGYRYDSHEGNCAHACLLPPVQRELAQLRAEFTRNNRPLRLFDLGCGNGSAGAVFHRSGWDVYGIDASTQGIAEAKQHYPMLHLELGSAYDDLASRFGQFPVVVSLEVVEHLYAPRDYARTIFNLLEPGGTAIISTPFHGYFKNLALALAGRMDKHFSPLWDHGHIKFWSIPTLKTLLEENGFSSMRFLRVGRVPALARSVIAMVRRP